MPIPIQETLISNVAEPTPQPGAGVAARVKVLDPLMTMGPSSPALVLSMWDSGLRLKVHRAILRGSMVQVRIGDKLAFGRVRLCLPAGAEFEISVEQVKTP